MANGEYWTPTEVVAERTGDHEKKRPTARSRNQLEH